MNPNIEVRSESCFVWTVASLTTAIPLRSPAFFFAKEKWCFELSIRNLWTCNQSSLPLLSMTSLTPMHTDSDARSNVINTDSLINYSVRVQATYKLESRYPTPIYSDPLTRKASENFYFTPDNHHHYFRSLSGTDTVTSMRINFTFTEKVIIDGFSHKSDESEQSKDNLIDDIKGLLSDSSLCDVEMKCEDGRSIKAHRLILSARSKVFKAMLQSDMEEGRSGVVKIPDMDVKTLKLFLHYIYSADLPDLTADAAKQLYEAGDKYGILCLKKMCAEFLAENFSAENVCDLLVTADLHSDENFKEKAVAYILEKKIPCRKELWSDFRKSHLHLAAEVLTRFYETQNPNVSE